eukprot:2007562-Alexandrium_andersonii.AAC.1
MSEDGPLLDTNEDPYEAFTRTALAENFLTDQVLPEARAKPATASRASRAWDGPPQPKAPGPEREWTLLQTSRASE